MITASPSIFTTRFTSALQNKHATSPPRVSTHLLRLLSHPAVDTIHSDSRKTALITGAAGGLGRAIAEQFLLEGANVVVCDVNDSLLADFEEKVSPAYPGCTLVLKTDITSESALDSLFAEAEAKFGQIDHVVNSAGMMDGFDPAGDLERELWDRVIALNLTAPMMVTKRAVRSMLKHEVKGSIVNIASVAGFRGFTSGAAYTVSKHGLLVSWRCFDGEGC